MFLFHFTRYICVSLNVILNVNDYFNDSVKDNVSIRVNISVKYIIHSILINFKLISNALSLYFLLLMI